MGLLDLFPQPQHVTVGDSTIELDGRVVTLDAAELPPLAQRGVALAQAQTAQNSTAAPYHIRVSMRPTAPIWAQTTNRDEAYQLTLDTTGGELVAAGPAGIFAGCQTLRQLLTDQPSELPALEILDWPDMRYRGLYVESKWGPDLMTLDDWQALIDYLATLKFNSLGVGVHCCWVTQYGGKTTEFMMLPFPDQPELSTPKTLRYYAPSAGEWQTLTYLPRMVTDDFFGELVAYAKANNITIRPHFNTPGHNTLIPRAYPEVSARSEDGTPLGYGFCFSNPRTYELLFSLYDSVIQRYLRPHGIDWFHIGLDEVTGYMGIDPQRPFEVLEPWCQCAECRMRSNAANLQMYAVRVCTHLKEQGINHITLWNDGLDRIGALTNEFTQMVEEAGLRKHVILQWWRYREPPLVPRPELGLRAWVTPMAGYWSNLFTQSYTSNINSMLLHGYRAGAEGADAYCIYDPAFDRNYACLAQYAWNQHSDEDIYQFKSRYAQAKLATRLDPALATEAFEKYDQAFDSMPWTGTVLDSLLYYWHTYPASRRRGNYPFSVLADLTDEHMRLRSALDQAAVNATSARDLFQHANEQAHDPLLAQYRAECDKLVGVWAMYSQLLGAARHYDDALAPDLPPDQVVAHINDAGVRIEEGQARLVAVLADLEQVKEAYLQPQILRDLSILLVYMEQWRDELASLSDSVSAGRVQTLPAFSQLTCNQTNLDPFVSSSQ